MFYLTMEYLPDLEINKDYAATFHNNCAVIHRNKDGHVMGVCAYHLADGKTCPVHGVVKAVRADQSRVAAELMTDEEAAKIDPEWLHTDHGVKTPPTTVPPTPAPAVSSPLNPGIASTVRWLQSVGFATTDSGDGVTRGFGCDPGVPYVHMIVQPERLIEETRRLVSLLAAKGIVLGMMNESGTAPTVDGCFQPIPGIATISLWNVIVDSDNDRDSSTRKTKP